MPSIKRQFVLFNFAETKGMELYAEKLFPKFWDIETNSWTQLEDASVFSEDTIQWIEKPDNCIWVQVAYAECMHEYWQEIHHAFLDSDPYNEDERFDE